MSDQNAETNDDTTHPTCSNCGAPLTGEYCAGCGQHNRYARLVARTIVGQVFDDLFDLNLPIVRTARDLTVRPGAV